MGTGRYLARRTAWTVVAAWLVLSGAFFVYAYAPDPNVPLLKFAAGYGAALEGGNVTEAQRQAVRAYVEARNYDEPVLQRYVRWMTAYLTLDWGYSFTHGAPVAQVVARRAPITLAYLVPAVLLAVTGGVGLGLYAATHPRGLADYLGTSFAYAGQGLPSFFLAEAAVALAVRKLGWYSVLWDPRYGLWTATNLLSLLVPALVVAVNMLAVQARYARAEAREYVPAAFVKTVRASGASPRDVARHVLRNAAIPLVSVFFTEVLSVLFVTIYVVEVALDLPGLGRLAYSAILDRDIGVILATTLIPVFVGLAGNLLQDVAYAVLDPRIDYDGES